MSRKRDVRASPRLRADSALDQLSPSAAKAAKEDKAVIPAVKSLCENWVVPPGLESFLPLYPALKRWAKFARPSGAEFSSTPFHQVVRKLGLTQTLKRWAKLVRPSGAEFSSTPFHQVVRKLVLKQTLKRCATQNQAQHGLSQSAGSLDRRSFFKCALMAGTACGVEAIGRPLFTAPLLAASPAQDDSRFIVEAKFYQKLKDKEIKCKLCPRECAVGDRERGYCGVRENRGGTYYTLVHSRVCAAHVDPVEKKPLFHYLPGTLAFSLATAGCNVNCKFCQNWDISQVRPEQVPAEYAPPKRVAELAKQYQCPTIAYTYSEPVVFSEYVMDAADAGHEAGIRSVAVSNGYMQEESLKAAYGKMDAVKIDLKAFSESYYKDVVTGELKPVLDALVTLRKMGKWTEIVYLVIPTLNDSDSEFRGLARWIKTNLGVDVPIHFTQFHPQYLLKNLPITPVPTLERAKAIADAEGLHFVYIGNVPGHPAQNTYCPKCRRMLVERVGFTASQMLIRKGNCPFCQQRIPGVWHA